MSYQSLIRKNVNKVFRNIKDLGILITFNRKAVTGYNFGTGTVDAITDSVSINGIVVKSIQEVSPDGGDTIKSTIVVNSENIDDISMYDTLIINGITWKIVSPIVDNGYTIRLTAVRGV